MIAGCRQQVLHNDFNTSNIVIDAHRPQCVGAIIDFGDTVKTAIAIDVSTAMMNQLLAVDPGQDLDIFAPPRICSEATCTLPTSRLRSWPLSRTWPWRAWLPER